MEKIQSKVCEKIQRKRRAKAIALPQLGASRISHKQAFGPMMDPRTFRKAKTG